MGLRTVIHEANAVAGVADRFLGRLVDRVLLGFGEAAPAFPRRTTVLTGTPVRAAVRALAGARAEPRVPGPVHVLVVGGSQGSAFLNAQVPGVVVRVAYRGLALEVRHQTGLGDPDPVRAAYQCGGVAADVQTSFDDVTAAYRWADLAIACAGAITLAELAIAGLPALLVPLATAALDYQRANARAFAAMTGRGRLGCDGGRGAPGRAGGVGRRAAHRGGADGGGGATRCGGRSGGSLREPPHRHPRARSHRAVTTMASAATATAAIVAGRPATTASTATAPSATHTP